MVPVPEAGMQCQVSAICHSCAEKPRGLDLQPPASIEEEACRLETIRRTQISSQYWIHDEWPAFVHHPVNRRRPLLRGLLQVERLPAKITFRGHLGRCLVSLLRRNEAKRLRCDRHGFQPTELSILASSTRISSRLAIELQSSVARGTKHAKRCRPRSGTQNDRRLNSS